MLLFVNLIFLILKGLRTKCSIIVETGEAREVHHFCVLAGYGAEAVHPYLALDSLRYMTETKNNFKTNLIVLKQGIEIEHLLDKKVNLIEFNMYVNNPEKSFRILRILYNFYSEYICQTECNILLLLISAVYYRLIFDFVELILFQRNFYL